MNGSALAPALSPTEAYPSGRKRLQPGAYAPAPGTPTPGSSEAGLRPGNDSHATALCLTSDIVAAFVSNNDLSIAAIPGLISDVYAALSNLGLEACGRDAAAIAPTPFVPVGRSVRPDHIFCLVCGHRGKSLKQHLRLVHRLTPDEYRRRFALASDYPLVAPEYAERRREIALRHGLGRTGSRARSTSGDEASTLHSPREPST